jgi:hypothetical protein
LGNRSSDSRSVAARAYCGVGEFLSRHLDGAHREFHFRRAAVYGLPYKAATNPVFYLKLTFIALGVFLALKIKNGVLSSSADFSGDSKFPRRAKQLAGASMLCWVGAITAGRLLAYTFTWLRVGIPGGF